MSVLRRLFLPILILLGLAPGLAPGQTAALPADGAPIKEVRVEGTSRLAPTAIINRMELREGGTFSADAYRRDIQSIADAGVVDPLAIRISWTQDDAGAVTLVVTVKENAIIAAIRFIGNVRFKEKELIAQLDDKVGDLAKADLRSATARNVRNFYRDGGFKSVKITVETPAAGDGSINLVITVDEGARIKIHKLIVNGNEHFSDFYLGTRLTNAPGLLFFSNYFDELALDEDMAVLRAVYQDAGYLDVKASRGEPIYEEDKKRITLVYTVEEGPRYRVKSARTEGVSLFTAEEVRKATVQMTDRTFKGQRLAKSVDKISTLYGNEGYVDTEIGYRLDKDPESRTVDVVFDVTEKPVVYVGQIRLKMEDYDYNVEPSALDRALKAIAPPTKTETVLKEVRLKSGEKYRAANEVRTIERLKNLGIFRTVDIVRTPTSDPGVRDALVVVDEDPAAAFIGATAGVGERSGPSVTFTIDQPNWGGRADRAYASATIGTRSRAFRIGFFDRYIGDSDTSVDSAIYYDTDRYRVYRERTIGASTEFGKPLGERLTGYLRFRLEHVKFSNIDDDPEPEENFDSYYVVAARPMLVYDQRDNIRRPTRGYLVGGGVEVGAADGFLLKLLHNYEWYKKPFERSDLVYAYQHTVGVMPYDATNIGISERFFVGGTSTLRGFRARGVGPRDERNEDLAIGGATRITQRHELRYPFSEYVTGRVFTDAAILEKGPVELGTPRVGSGVGALLKIGPVNAEVDFAVPVLIQSDDERQFFHLKIGSNF